MAVPEEKSAREVPAREVVAWDHGRMPADGGLAPLAAGTGYSRLLVRSLMRAQLGLSLLCLAVALAVTASFPVVAALRPAVLHVRVAGLPLTLVVLGGGIYPVLLAIGWFYTRQARLLEARFAELVGPVRGPAPGDDG